MTHVRSDEDASQLTELPMLKIGSEAIGRAEAQSAIQRNISALVELNESRARKRLQLKQASQNEAILFQNALKTLLASEIPPERLRSESFTLDVLPDFSSAFKLQRYGQQQATLMLPLSKRVNVFGPPYDYDWSWGNPTRETSDPSTGICSVFAQSPITSAAAAGIGLLLTSDKPAFVFVRAYITYEWQAAAKTIGIGSTAKVWGGIDSSAWVDGKLHTEVRRDQVFDISASWFDNEERASGEGVAWSDNISLNFRMTAGKTYAVSLGAWVECVHSTGVGGAGSAGVVTGTVKFVVIERFVAG